MKRNIVLITIFLAIFLIIFKISQAQELSDRRQITVTGEADVYAVPDIVSFVVGVETWNRSIDAAKENNDKKIKNIIYIAKSFNIPDKKIRTDYFNLSPTYSDSHDEKIKGFRLNNNVTLELSTISLLDSIMTSLIKADLTNIYGIRYLISEPRKLKDEARRLAIKAAKEKAADMAAVLGMNIGNPFNIIENSDSGNIFYPRNMYANTAMDKGYSGGTEESATQGGQIKIRASVTVTFDLE